MFTSRSWRTNFLFFFVLSSRYPSYNLLWFSVCHAYMTFKRKRFRTIEVILQRSYWNGRAMKKRGHIAISRRCARVVLASWGKARQLSQIWDYEHKSWNIIWLCGYDKMRRSQDLDDLHKAWRQKNASVDIDHTILINHPYRVYVLTFADCSNTAHTSSDDTYLWVTV